MFVAVPAIPLSPRTPAIIATIKNITARLIITNSFIIRTDKFYDIMKTDNRTTRKKSRIS